MKNDSVPETAEDIKVQDIYGIYQNKCKAFWECKVANLKFMNEMDSNNPKLLESYVLKEIDLETSNIITSYMLKDRSFILDTNNKTHKIPTFYNDVQISSNINYSNN